MKIDFARAHWLEARMTPQLWTILARAWAWLAFILIVLASSLYFFQKPFLSYPDGTVFPMTASTVPRGSTITLLATRCNESSDMRSYKLARKLVRVDKAQDDTAVFDGDVTILGKTCDVLRKPYRMPDDLPPGLYRVDGEAIVPGWFRTFYIHYTSTPFIVQ